ncbi:hydroxypyruvate isomerase [Erwinia sorbitola]|uniref:Hydroxypyruvate isomerase n=1 Tax=Erwinia sorbitola TaxID=2681984 RepID=A0A6I6EQQ4_9GAMM|nr:hydroxypyruvate isomerase [Erwinia sorbitola]MTD27005.1 hydroxypyruvate isomerase [Erwinia sorbitola]QGU88566.1 hydroxypyruvate isomerase [Erwinia sorbitola]
MPKFSANLSMLFNEVDFMQRFRLAKQQGFSAVEYMFPYDYPMDAIRKELDENQLTQVLQNLPAGDWAAGERGIACLPGRESEFRDGVGLAIDYAKKLGCGQINCLIGNVDPSLSQHHTDELVIANLSYAAQELADANIRLLIEPINKYDMPNFYLKTSQQAIELIEKIGNPNIYLQYDIYHMQRMEGELTQTMERLLAKISHIQVADNPGRNEPGTGEINYDYIFSALDRMGYSGWIGCEYKPKDTTESGLSWMKKYQS